MDHSLYVNWALSDFDIDGKEYNRMNVSELGDLMNHQINLNHTVDRCQLTISKNVLLSNKLPVKSFSNNRRKEKRVSFSDLSLNEVR